MGMNNIKANDYVNVVIQGLAHVKLFRDYLLTNSFDSKRPLVKTLSESIRKLWNPKAFKAHHSPHELMAVRIIILYNDHSKIGFG
jgi:U4/U6.U5 tri-snRNP-associated protein 2